MEYIELQVDGLAGMQDIHQILAACQGEALKLKHHYPLNITRSVAQHFWTAPTSTPITVKHGWAYLEVAMFNHHTFKETVKRFKVKIF